MKINALSGIRRSFPRRSIFAIFILTGILLMVSCVVDPDDELAPYRGHRPLLIEKVTHSFTADVAWLGGRVAAIGVNRGPVAALDTSLVWIQTSDDNSIDSYVTVGEHTNASLIESFGGVPLETLEDGVEYTFWIAEKSIMDVSLNPAERTGFNFADTTLTMKLLLRGQNGGGNTADGDPVASMRIQIDERLETGKRYIIMWDEGTLVRRIAIRNHSTGGFTDLIWHIVTPDDESDNISAPVIIGEPYPGTLEATPWPDDGWVRDQEGATLPHIVWMATSDWTPGTWGPRAAGYAWFRIFRGEE
jgi:hypothetical protein